VKNIIFLKRDLRRERFRFTGLQGVYIYIYYIVLYISFLSFPSWYFQIVILDYYRRFYNIYWASTWKRIYVTVNCYQKTMNNAFILRSAHNIINGCIIRYYYYSLCNFRCLKRVFFSFNLWKIEYKRTVRFGGTLFENILIYLTFCLRYTLNYYRAGRG